jgi:hypothetical protein
MNIAVAPAATPATTAPARAITKEQAVEMALKAHPGEVTKAYEDTKKGKQTWEVKINGTDGKKWEVHYEIKTGALVSEKASNRQARRSSDSPPVSLLRQGGATKAFIMSTIEANEMAVWDPLVRLFHWSLVISFCAAWFSEGEWFESLFRTLWMANCCRAFMSGPVTRLPACCCFACCGVSSARAMRASAISSVAPSAVLATSGTC